jgi:CRP-like cAMP-binding protein
VPSALRFKANSYIFFKGDGSERVYVLKSGKVSLNYKNETGQEMHELVKTGEFFGVKSALGRYPREETAIVLNDADVVAFNVPEFEQYLLKNTPLIVKTLRVYSNQLRRIHNQVQNLISTREQVDSEEGLYSIGEYYMRAKKYALALYPYKRYLVYYPSGRHADDVTRKIQVAEGYVSRYPSGRETSADPAPAATAGAAPAAPLETQETSEISRRYYNAVSLVSQEKYLEAFKEFRKIAAGAGDDEYQAKAQYEMGKCLYHTKQYGDCIKVYTALVQKYPKHPDLADALLYVGLSHQAQGDGARAVGLYKKILTLVPADDAVARKARKALRGAESDAG